MLSVEQILTNAETTADNIEFLCSLSQRRFDCILRTAKMLQTKLKGE